jgi:ribonuclease VapC
MIIDSSAIIAILRNEQDAPELTKRIERANYCSISAANFVEVSAIVLRSADAEAVGYLDRFIREAAIIIQPVTAKQAFIARDAYQKFGKGSQHPAQLNFGDCFSYHLRKI